MKCFLSLVVMLLLFPLFVFAQPEGGAEELYNKGDYMGAALAYEQEVSSPAAVMNPYLYYNLANSYFKAGDIDKAVLNYYRAFNILPRDRDIRGNLAFALASTGQRLVPEGMPKTAFNFYHYLSIKELRGLLWVSIWAFAAALCAYVFTAKKEASLKALKIIGIFLFLFTMWYGARLPAANRRKAVTVVPRAEVRSGPGEHFPVSLSLPNAYITAVTDTKGDYAEIEAGPEKMRGWVLKKSVEEI